MDDSELYGYPLYYQVYWPESQKWLDRIDEYDDYIVPSEDGSCFVEKTLFESEYGL